MQTRYIYDPNGNLTDVVDPLNVVTHNEFDALNRRTATIANYKPAMTPTARPTCAPASPTIWPAI